MLWAIVESDAVSALDVVRMAKNDSVTGKTAPPAPSSAAQTQAPS